MQSIPVSGFLAPSIWNTRENIRNDAAIITSPIIEATICPLAASTFVLSPPDNIHLMPPKIRKATAITIPITKRRVITNCGIFSIGTLPTLPAGGVIAIGIIGLF